MKRKKMNIVDVMEVDGLLVSTDDYRELLNQNTIFKKLIRSISISVGKKPSTILKKEFIPTGKVKQKGSKTQDCASHV